MRPSLKQFYLFSKRAQATIGLMGIYAIALIFTACMEDEYYIEGCPIPSDADAINLVQVFYSPYSNQRYSTESDTVDFSGFRFNFEIEVLERERAFIDFLPGKAYALSCIKSYNILNISNISVILVEPFAGLPIGTDIGYLLETPDGQKISELREFWGVQVYFGAQLKISPENYSQLKTRTFLFLKDGRSYFVESTSPYLKTT